MNRRTVLRVAGASVAVGLAGCVDGVQEHFGLQGVIPIEIHSEADRTHNVHLEAHERETNRQSYEQSYSVTPDEVVGAPNLDRTDQSLRVAKIVDDEPTDVREVSITEHTELVLVWLYDDDIVIDVQRGEAAESENATDDEDTNSTATDGDGTDGE